MTNNDTLEAASLSPAQQAIVLSTASQIGVAAGPGSGKTHTLVARIRHRIEQMQVPPLRIAVMTFTNAGAAELRKRLDGIELGYIGTLHGYLFRLIQKHGTLIGYRAGGVNLVGEEDAAEMLAACAKRMGYRGSQKALEARTPGDSQADLVWRAYASELRRNNMVDYDTVLSDGFQLLATHQVETGRWIDLYVDEAQDSAAIDWDIYWAFPADNLFAVGDPDQSIYAFRGAKPEMFVRYMGSDSTTRFLLEENYRSGTSICRAATNLISHNGTRVYKIVKPREGATVGRVSVLSHPSWAAERQTVALSADATSTAGDEVAVLCRTNAQVQDFRAALKQAGIPVAEIERPPLPEGWRHAMAVLQLALDPASGALAERVMRGMGMAEGQIRELKLTAMREERRLSHYIHQREYAAGLETLSLYNVDREAIGLIWERWSLLPRPSLIALLHDLYSMRREGTLRHTGVVVCTIHAAKGREWDHVILPGWEEGTVPMLKRDSDAEECRRLAFVAITRARHSVLITYASERTPPHGNCPEQRTPSRFIKEAAL